MIIFKQSCIRNERAVHQENPESFEEVPALGIVRSRQHRLRQLEQPL